MRYNQLFYVGLKSKCRGVSSDGYLPALEIEEELKPDNDDTKHQELEWSKKQWQQLRGEMKYMRKIFYQHLNEQDQTSQKKEKVENRSGIEI